MCTDGARDAVRCATNSPYQSRLQRSPRLALPLASCLHRLLFPSSLSSFAAIQSPSTWPCRCHAVSPLSPPDDTRASLDTGQVAPCSSRSTPCESNVPARGIHFFGHIVVYGIIDFVPPFPSRSFHRTQSTTALFYFAPAVASRRQFIFCFQTEHRPPFTYDAAR